MNERVTPKDRNAIKGALRRAFARSDLHAQVIARITVEHSDPRNPRCMNWGYCELCGVVQPRWRIAVDHVIPVVAVDTTFEAQGVEATIERMWCDPANLQGICETCHDEKTRLEKEERKKYAPPKKPRIKKTCTKR